MSFQTVTVSVTFPVAFGASVVPVVVATPLQGSGGGGANNNATFLCVVREVSATGFTVSMHTVGGAVWNQEATLTYIAAVAGKVDPVAVGPGVLAIAGHGDIGEMMDKKADPATKTATITFPPSVAKACLGRSPVHQQQPTGVLSPETTRGAGNTDVYVLTFANISCTGAVVVASRVATAHSNDTFWGQDLKLDYLVFMGTTADVGVVDGARLPQAPSVQAGAASATAVTSPGTITTATIKFPTAFAAGTTPSVYATPSLDPAVASTSNMITPLPLFKMAPNLI